MLLKFESFLLQNACNIPLKIFTAPSNHGIYDHLSSYNYSMNIYLQYRSHGYNSLKVNNDKPKLFDAIVLENTIGHIETRKYRHISKTLSKSYSFLLLWIWITLIEEIIQFKIPCSDHYNNKDCNYKQTLSIKMFVWNVIWYLMALFSPSCHLPVEEWIFKYLWCMR
jgi:hypothetical protein